MARFLVCLAIISNLVYQVTAFLPNKYKLDKYVNIDARTHEEHTRAAWKSLSDSWFGTVWTNAMESALQTVVDANGKVDDDQTRAELHFDGESFPEGQVRLQTLAVQVAQALANNNAPQARSLLGQALHSVQDFYSHSNWVELGNTLPNPDLGMPGKSLTRLEADVATCTACTLVLLGCNVCDKNQVTNLLTSGYYPGENRKSPNGGKCQHGGIGQIEATQLLAPFLVVPHTTDGINKDTGYCGLSPHSSLHQQAANAAQAASKQYIQSIKSSLTDDQLKSLFAVDQSVSVYSTTGSSTKVRRALGIEGNSKLKRSGHSSAGVYEVPLGHRSVQMNFMDHESHAIHRRDEAEDTLAGLYNAITSTNRGDFLFLFADSAAQIAKIDAGFIGGLAIALQVRIFYFITTADPQHPDQLDPDLFDAIHYAGGQVFFVTEDELNTVPMIMSTLLRDDGVDIVRYAPTNSTSATVQIPLDTTLRNVTFSISGTPNVTIQQPDGSELTLADNGINAITLTDGLFLTVTKPTAGVWTVDLPSNANQSHTSLIVTASSLLDFEFDFTELSGRPGHEGYAPLRGLPPANTNVMAAASISDLSSSLLNSLTFSRRDNTGTTIGSPFNFTLTGTNSTSLTSNSSSGTTSNSSVSTFYTYNETNMLAAVDFYSYVSGASDGSGYAFQRLKPSKYHPSLIAISAPPPSTIHPNSSRSLTFLVSNYAPDALNIDLSFTDGRGWLTPIAAQNQTGDNSAVNMTLSNMAFNSSIEVTLDLVVPANEEIGATNVIGVFAGSQGVSSSNDTDDYDEDINFSFVDQWVVNGTALNDVFYYNGTVGGDDYTDN